MKPNEIVRTIMTEQDVGVAKMGDRMGKSMRLVCDRLRQENMTTDKLLELLRVLDYKIVIMPNENRLPKDSYEVE